MLPTNCDGFFNTAGYFSGMCDMCRLCVLQNTALFTIYIHHILCSSWFFALTGYQLSGPFVAVPNHRIHPIECPLRLPVADIVYTQSSVDPNYEAEMYNAKPLKKFTRVMQAPDVTRKADINMYVGGAHSSCWTACIIACTTPCCCNVRVLLHR